MIDPLVETLEERNKANGGKWLEDLRLRREECLFKPPPTRGKTPGKKKEKKGDLLKGLSPEQRRLFEGGH